MTIDELIERLEDYRDDARRRRRSAIDDATATGRSRTTSFGLASGEEINDAATMTTTTTESDHVVYICEGQQLCYGTKRAWEAAH